MYTAHVFPANSLVIIDSVDFLPEAGVTVRAKIVKELSPPKVQLGQDMSLMIRSIVLEGIGVFQDRVFPRTRVVSITSDEITLGIVASSVDWISHPKLCGVAGEQIAAGQLVYVQEGKVYAYAVERTGGQELREHQER